MPEPIFERFPLDGALYRLVSAGKVAAPLTSMTTARVRLWLVKIDESDPKNLKWASRPSGMLATVALEEAAGSLPKLILGSFWRDRTLQSGYTMPQDVEVRNAALGPQAWQIVRASDRGIGVSGLIRIPAGEYPLTGEDARGSPLYFHDAPLLRCFTESGLELLIPCYEIFRRFYGLTSELSNAMLAGHWKRELATLVDMERTRVSEDGKSFEVLPRVDLRDIGCMGVALFLTMATASSRAAEIFPAIENARRSGIREPWILAYPPWHNQTMSLNLVGHQMHSGAVLVQWIYSSPFPHLPYQVVRIDPNLCIPVANEDAAVQPARASPEDRMQELEDATIQSAKDARASRGAVHFGLGDFWDGLIRVKRNASSSTYVPFNPESEGAPPPRRRLRLTTGRRSDIGRSPTASLSSDAQNIILNRFNALAECFDELLQAGDIQAREDYAIVNPIPIGNHDYCAFPMSIGGTTRPWALVNPENPRPRLCWVSEITSLEGSFYYWIEVEALSREAFKALVVKPNVAGSRLNADTLETILKIGAIDKGQWKKAALFTVEEQVQWLSARHSFASGRLRSSVVLGKLRSFR